MEPQNHPIENENHLNQQFFNNFWRNGLWLRLELQKPFAEMLNKGPDDFFQRFSNNYSAKQILGNLNHIGR